MPESGCSPVGSTQVNLGPKSLNTVLKEAQVRMRWHEILLDIPEQSTGVGSDEWDIILVRPVVDF